MRTCIKRILICFCIFFFWPALLLAQYPWPVWDMNEQHGINSTLGEFRGFGRVLHEGVDIAEGTNTEVLVNIPGTIYQKGVHHIGVKGEIYYYRYIHVLPNPNLKVGMKVGFSDLLGKIDEENHLHFEYLDGLYNPLHFLQPFYDYCAPTIDKIALVKDGTAGAGEPFPTDPETGLPIVSGYVDIKAWAWDPRVKADGQPGGKGCGIYKIGYQIFDEEGNLVEGLITRLRFHQTLGYNAGWIYVRGSSYDPVNFIYWVTNYVDKNGYWDTYPLEDGKYRVEVVAEDIQGRYEIEKQWVIVRNTCPVVVSTSPKDGEVEVDINTDIVITFSKEMNQLSVNPATILFNPPLTGSFTCNWDTSGKTVTLTLTDPEHDLEFLQDYEVTVTDGVRDINGIQLDGDKDGEPGGAMGVLSNGSSHA